MTVVNHTANQIWLQLVKNQQKINFLIVVLLAIFLLAYVAELTWRLWPQPAANSKVENIFKTQPTSTKSANNVLNLAGVKRLNLFGNYDVAPVVEEESAVIDAPVTRLSLVLTGVVASSSKDQGAAIIENQKKQQTYGVGEKVDGTNATLKEVYADRVIIKNGLTNETLMLDGVEYKKNVVVSAKKTNPVDGPKPNKRVADRRTLSDEAARASIQLQNEPANFADYIAVSPHRPNGELVGYRVRPGKNPALFKAAGLITGDVITEINGLYLSDIQQALEAMKMLKELQSLQMTVQRKDEFITIYLDLPQGEEESQT